VAIITHHHSTQSPSYLSTVCMVTTSTLLSGKHRRCRSTEHRLTTSTTAHSSQKKKQHHPCLAKKKTTPPMPRTPTQVACFHFHLVLKSILLSASTATAKIPPLPSSNSSYDYAANSRLAAQSQTVSLLDVRTRCRPTAFCLTRPPIDT
jgi:hypothetical protein